MTASRLVRSFPLLNQLKSAFGCAAVAAIALSPGCTGRPPTAEIPETAEAAQLVADLDRQFRVSSANNPLHGADDSSHAISEAEPVGDKLRARPPMTADGAVELRDIEHAVEVRLHLDGARPTGAESAKQVVVYRDALESGASILHRPQRDGFEQYLSFPSRPARSEIKYRLDLIEGVVGVRLISDTVELLDRDGAPRLKMSPPYLISADGAVHRVSVSLSGCTYDTDGAPPWDRALKRPESSACTITLGWSDVGVHYPMLLDPTWSATTSMANGRFRHTATLAGGRVIVIGGYSGHGAPPTSSVEAFDPRTQSWATLPSMSAARAFHTAVYLPSRSAILVAGGFGSGAAALSSAELFNVATSSWSSAGNMAQPRAAHGAVLLPTTGAVLLAGGTAASGPLASCELYDASGFHAAPGMAKKRAYISAVYLASPPTVFIAGGLGDGPGTTESYAVGGGWTSTGNLYVPRYDYAASFTPEGIAVLVGGIDTSSNRATPYAEYFVSGTRRNGDPFMNGSVGRHAMAIARVPSGGIMVAGGGNSPDLTYTGNPFNEADSIADSSVLYSPWAMTSWMRESRYAPTLTPVTLGNGRLAMLAAGGQYSNYYDPLASSELYVLGEPGDTCRSGAECAQGQCLFGVCSGLRGPGKTCSNGAQCASTYCASGTCCVTACNGPCQTCDSSGTCNGCAAGAICAANNHCVASYCDAATACPSGYFCSVGKVCAPKLANGGAGGAAQCASGFSVDGVCCDRACTGGCERCDLAGSVGTCASIPAGERQPGRASCGGGFVCTGSADCTAACSADGQCADGYYCKSGACAPKLARGFACASDAQCGTGFCVDNVCCNSRCDAVTDSSGGQAPIGCGSCALANSLGTCTLAAIGSCANIPPFSPTPIPPGLSSSFVDVTRFLYQNGTQTMPDGSPLAAGVIRNDRGAVVRGRVLRDRWPLAGATVSVRNHPEYGRTFTRADGNYDLAVNGGESLVVRIDAPNHPSAFRESLVRPLDYQVVPDIVLVPYGAAQTIDLTDATQYHSAQSEIVGSGSAARQVTVLFPGRARVRMQLSTGTVDLPRPTVRITEYTRSDTDAAAMPASLPPTSGYTFAADFFVEPPVGVTEKPSAVTFVDTSGNTIALPMYVDNFLGFPVGETAPLGGYDESKAYWQASPSGKVTRILSVTNGIASIDDVGDGAAHDDHLPLDERKILGQLFPAAQNRDFMRVMLPHFSDWDVNCGKVPPDGARFPPRSVMSVPGDSPDTQTCRAGSIIECQAQTLSEKLGVSGTPLSLVYRSDRQLGYSARRIVEIPLDVSTFPDSMVGVEVQLQVAGRLVDRYMPRGSIDSSGRVTIGWDGLDSYGRAVWGETEARVRWGYVYNAVYAQTSVFGYNGGGRITRGGSGISTRDTVTLWTDWNTSWLASYDARSVGLHGWTLSAHHNYDMHRGVLYPGDGRARHVIARMPWQIDTLVGGPNAKLTALNNSAISGLAVGLGGALYFTRTPAGGSTSLWEYRDAKVSQVPLTMAGAPFTIANYNGLLAGERDGSVLLSVSNSIFRIALTRSGATTQGSVTVIAGQSGTCWATPSDSGDGGPAVSAKLCDVRGVSSGKDGSVFVSESMRIRRIAPDGTITTIYGPASVNPRTVTDGAMTIGPVVGADDGSVYFTGWDSWIRRITPEGFLVDVTSGSGGPKNDGDPGSKAGLGYMSGVLLLAGDGSIYFAQNDGKQLRRIRPDDQLETVGGVDTGYPSYSGDGGTALGPTMARVMSVTVGPLGEVLLIDAGSGSVPGIRRIVGPRPSAVDSAAFVPSDDGSEIYVFDATGRHQQTLDGMTGAPRLAFIYTNGMLSSVQQFNSPTGVPLTTTIDASGEPLVITGPYGHQTRIYKDSDGYGSIVVNPANEQTTFGFTAKGFMSTETDPRGNAHAFSYDALGRLIRDADPAGGVQTFTLSPARALVRVTTAEGAPAEHEVLTSGGSVTLIDRFQSSDSDVDRLVSTFTVANSGARSLVAADGSTAQTQPCNDPRFGAGVGTACGVTSTADGVTATVTVSETASCAATDCGNPVPCDISNLLVMRSRSEQVIVNGRSYSTQYDRCPAGTVAPTELLTTATTKRQQQVKFDAIGRITSVGVVDARPTALYPARYTYTDDGRVKTISRGTPGPDERVATFAYNPSSSDGASGALQSITVAGSGSAPDPHVVTLDGYDAAGRLVHSLLPGGRGLQVGRDGAGNVASITPPGSSAHLMPHDSLDRVAQYQPPSVGAPTTTTYQFDRDRRVTTIAQPGDVAVGMSYDARGRLKTVTHPSRTFTLNYESGTPGVSGAPATPGFGRVTSIVDQQGTTLSFGYGPTGSTPLSETWSGGTLMGSVSRTLDADHRMATESVNGSDTVAYGYDDDDALVMVGTMKLSPDPANAMFNTTTLGVVGDARTHNRFGELATYTATAGANTLFRVTYDDFAAANVKPRDNLGRVRRKSEAIFNSATGQLDNVVRDYVYDDAGRLWRVLDGAGAILESYQYDLNGNRTSATVNGISVTDVNVDAQDRLLRYASVTYTYTPAGQRRTRTVGSITTTYDWDGYGNLTRVSWQNTRIDYSYDAQHRRIARRKWNGSTLVDERHWLYGDQLRIVAELDGSNNLLSRFVYGTRGNVPDYVVRAGATYRVVTDELGSVRLVVNSADGNVAQRTDYADAFGTQTANSNAPVVPFGFAGGIYDPDTGLVKFGARDYDSYTGTWIAKDSLGFGGGDTNLYRYVRGNPVNLFDPTGASPMAASPNPFDCNSLTNQIVARITELAKRAKELVQDPLDLAIDYWFDRHPIRGIGSVNGHIKQFNDKQKNLQYMMKDFEDNKCGGKGFKMPENALDMATRQAPIPYSRFLLPFIAIGQSLQPVSVPLPDFSGVQPVPAGATNATGAAGILSLLTIALILAL